MMIIAPLLLAIPLMQTSHVPAGYKLKFSDEFDYKGLPNPDKWTYDKGFIANNEKQFYVEKRLENSRVDGKNLTIEARKDGFGGHDISSARIKTQDKYEFKYGYVEVRAKIPTGRGAWPAIWMLGANINKVGWPLCGEIDMMENVGYDPERVHFNVHTKAYHHSIGTNKGTNIAVKNVWEDYHTYGLLWTPTKLVWYFDGKQTFEFAKESDDPTKWPFDAEEFIILNVAAGGDWGGQKGIDDKIFPLKFLIDYVRVYQKG